MITLLRSHTHTHTKRKEIVLYRGIYLEQEDVRTMGLAATSGVNGNPLFPVRIKASTKNVYGIGLVGQCASEERAVSSL